MDNILQFLKTVWSNLGDIVHHNHRINSICFLREVLQNVSQ